MPVFLAYMFARLLNLVFCVRMCILITKPHIAPAESTTYPLNTSASYAIKSRLCHKWNLYVIRHQSMEFVQNMSKAMVYT